MTELLHASQSKATSRSVKGMVLYAATSNPGKLREFRESACDLTVEPLPGLAGMPEPMEDALTFMGNAELKAVAYSRGATGLLVFADDSGLEVDALEGRPGVRSARFADDLGFEPDSTAGRNARNLQALLAQMADVAVEQRQGRFRCALALAHDGEVLLRAEGTVEGVILREARGVGGFGYDSVFFVPGLGKTLAEMSSEEKWSVSHRGRAFRELLARVRALGRCEPKDRPRSIDALSLTHFGDRKEVPSRTKRQSNPVISTGAQRA